MRRSSEFTQLGITGYVDKTAPCEQLLQAVDEVISGALFLVAKAEAGVFAVPAPEFGRDGQQSADPPLGP